MALQEPISEAIRLVRSEFGDQALDITSLFLDDGVVAGEASAVARFIQLIEHSLSDIGLELNKQKCVVIPASGAPDSRVQPLFAGMDWRPDQNFKLLGAAFGSIEFCTAVVRKRADKAKRVMEQLGHMEDPQTAVLYCDIVPTSVNLCTRHGPFEPTVEGTDLQSLATT
jgi:hypothetical protein